MVIKGTEMNTFTAVNTGLMKKNGAEKASGNSFVRRFDTLELSSFFKNYDNAAKGKTDISDIKQMLSDIKNEETVNRLTDGITAYAYMTASLIGEAMRSNANAFLFSCYTDEKAYYQSLLDEADGIAPAGTEDNVIYKNFMNYEYQRPEDGEIDREQVEKALANVQKKIGDMLNNTMEHGRLGERTSRSSYNRCAGAFAAAFGVDSSDVLLDEDSFNKMFGKFEATEEDYVRKCEEKADMLFECYRSLSDKWEDSLKRMSSLENGRELVSAVKKALNSIFYDSSYKNIAELAAEAGLIEEGLEKE